MSASRLWILTIWLVVAGACLCNSLGADADLPARLWGLGSVVASQVGLTTDLVLRWFEKNG